MHKPKYNSLSADTTSSSYHRFEAFIDWQGSILEMITNGASLKDILAELCYWVEKEGGNNLFASVLLLDEEGKHLLHGAAPSLPEPYNQVIHGIEIGPAVGSCGTAAYTGETVIVEDIASDPLWKNFKSLALLYELRACWSTPLITNNNKVLGTFAVYYTEPRKPSEEDLRILRLLNKTAVIAIEARRAEDERIKAHLKEKATNVRLKEERQHFYRLLMNAPAIISVMKGPDHVYELANPLYMQAVGKTRNLLGKPIREALPELEGQGIYELLDSVYQTGVAYEGKELLIKLEQTEGHFADTYFNFVYQPIFTDDDKVEGILVHAVDVTEMVLARKRVEASEEKFRSFVLNAPTPIGIYVGREMLIQTANAAILQAWDRTYDEIKGKTFRQALPELEGQGFYELLEQVYDTGIPYNATEALVYLKRGDKVEATYYNFTYSPLRNEKGEIFGVMNTAAEVTDLVLAKQKLQETRERLSDAIEVSELGTWESFINSNKSYLSPRIEEWFGLKSGCSSAEIRSRIDEEGNRLLNDAVAKAMEPGSSGKYMAEFNVTTPEGKKRILRAKGKVIRDAEGNPLKLTGTTMDITQQKAAENELETLVQQRTAALNEINAKLINANKDLARMNKDLEHFAYVSSHDLQEPLRKIQLFSDVLLQNNTEELTDSAKKYITKISTSVVRMHTLVRDLLAYSRLKKPEVEFVPTDVNKIIEEVKDDFELVIAEKNVHFNIDKLPLLQANTLQVQQLFFNLISNAIKFTKQGVQPVISITSNPVNEETRTKFHHLNPNWNYCEIIVSDNGIGFDQQYEDIIFVIFQRLHNKDVFDGTGIGLALCKKIVNNHQGEIFAESKQGEGASFHVLLPLA